MKNFIIATIAFIFCMLHTNSIAQTINNEPYAQLLNSYVNEQGLVDYKSLKQNRASLDDYIKSLASVTKAEFTQWDTNAQLAYLINLYNAETLQLIVDNYPVKSIKDIGTIFSSPWSKPVVSLFGESITLDNLEHDIIRVDYNEPRIHMVLVCAAKGCPALSRNPYTADNLDEQLSFETTKYLKSTAGLTIDSNKKVANISSIFKWYKEDFKSVPQFVSQYSGNNVNDFKIKYINYDWSLNEQ